MMEQLGTLRQAGFFIEYASLSDEQLLEAVKAKRKETYKEMYGDKYEPGEFVSLNQLLAEDDKKFLDIDLEADVCDGNNVYVSLLENFAKASDGLFNPSGIIEEWETEEGPINLRFQSNGREVIFEPEYMDDWIDGRIFELINEEIGTVGNQQFVICTGPNDEWFGQNIIHIRLKPDEQHLLQEQLSWNFPKQY